MTPDQTAALKAGTPCNHHWHATGVIRTTNPPRHEELCCFCGERRLRRADEPSPTEPACGPFAPGGR